MTEYLYGFREIGPCDTRHEAIGQATIRAGGIHPPEYWRNVRAVPVEDVCEGLAEHDFFGACRPTHADPEHRCIHCGTSGVGQ